MEPVPSLPDAPQRFRSGTCGVLRSPERGKRRHDFPGSPAIVTSSSPMAPALSISHLRKVYRRGTVAVDDISLIVEEGDFFGFLGPNGAGKSTTIHCVTGIANPTSGVIEVFGIDAVRNYRDARRMIGLSP